MTSPTTEPNDRMRDDRRKRIERRKRRQKKINWVVMPFCVLIVAATIGFNVHYRLDRDRLHAAVTQVLESRGGEVVRIVHASGTSRLAAVTPPVTTPITATSTLCSAANRASGSTAN